MRAGQASSTQRNVFAGVQRSPLPRLHRTALLRATRSGAVMSTRSDTVTTEPFSTDVDDSGFVADLVPLSRAGLRARSRRRVRPIWVRFAKAATISSMVLAGAVTWVVCQPGLMQHRFASLSSAGLSSASGTPSSSTAPASVSVDSPVILATMTAGAAVRASIDAQPSKPTVDGRMVKDPDTTASIFTAAPASGGEFRLFTSGSTEINGKTVFARADLTGPSGASPRPIVSRIGRAASALTRLIPFESAPFPYAGTIPTSGSPFLDAGTDDRKGHRSWRGRVFWENETFHDNRVLMHIPAGFDAERPGVIVVFFHGHGATLQRDVLERQQVAAQISGSGANAVLLAPQFAVNAADSSVGKFWEPGGFKRFLDESAQRFAQLSGDPAAAQSFARMPVVIVGYSGGFAPAAWSLHAGGVTRRVRGVVMLDAMYGEFEKYADWIATSHQAFFVNCSTHFTRGGAVTLENMLSARGISSENELPTTLSRGGVVFLNVEASHADYVNTAWIEGPIRDILQRLPEYRLGGPEAFASSDMRLPSRSRTAAAH